MTLYIINVEWKDDILKETSALENLINTNFKNQKLLEGSYLILSSNTSVEIRNYLVNNLPAIHRIFIGEMSSSAAWRNVMSDSNDVKQMFNNE